MCMVIVLYSTILFYVIVYFINLKASLKIKNIIFENDLAKRGREITVIIQTNIMY